MAGLLLALFYILPMTTLLVIEVLSKPSSAPRGRDASNR